MPNPKRPAQNSRPFDPDKGLPLIGSRTQKKTGEGAAAKAEKDYQIDKPFKKGSYYGR